MGTSNDIPRAEFPPARYWRRWCADAAPPRPPALEADSGGQQDARASAGPAAAAAQSGQPPYSVLVVEDDRSQALFAESVLAGAGIQAQAVSDPALVMQTLESMRPDLVLMDLHMPAIDGAELTDMIRAHATLAHTPIVFLTGDPDPERQFEILEIGADDFLSKPIRPRHLIAAVENRIMRARQQQAQRTAPASGDPGTGLLTRTRMFQRLAAAVPSDTGSLYLVEIEGVAALRERVGYSALEALLADAAQRMARLAGEHAAARLNDNTLLVHVATELDADEFARHLRDGLARREDGDEDGPRLCACVGCARISPAFSDAGEALAAAEQALRDARAQPHGIAMHTASSAPQPEADGMTGEITSAVAERRIELAFQPIVAVAGGDEAQYQVLMRLRGSEDTLHTAATILPVAEAAGLVHDIDRQVLEQAIGVLQRQQHAGAGVRLFVSQSASTLSREGYADWLLKALGNAGVRPDLLVIDVQQDDALVHAITLQEFSARMVPTGVQLCLGRYDPGREIDLLLPQLPLSFVRLAPGFSSRLVDPGVRDRMREAVERAHRLGLLVIGQQVEDPQAAATLWMSGIDFIQGNLVQQAAGDLDFDFHHSVL